MEHRRVLMGKGILNWPTKERVGDRYGLVGLWSVAALSFKDLLSFDIEPLEGIKGKLVVKVIEARESQHIGDLYHGFYPTTPDVGEEIILGEGSVFYEDGFVGLAPDDGRRTFWLEPKKLYRAHQQLVELYFEKLED